MITKEAFPNNFNSNPYENPSDPMQNNQAIPVNNNQMNYPNQSNPMNYPNAKNQVNYGMEGNQINSPMNLTNNPLSNQMNTMEGSPMNNQMMLNGQTPEQSANPFTGSNEGIANGFGPMFFNVRDPSFNKTNTPIPQESSNHPWVICGSICFWVILILAAILISELIFLIAPLIISYFFYLCISIGCSDIRIYFSNIKKFEQYQTTYDKMVVGKGYFRFYIECYHYVQTRDSKGRSKRRKVVTHTANEIFTLTNCFDESGELMSIQDIKNYVFLHYTKRYYFDDDRSQNIFISIFNAFVQRNIRDQYQSYSHNFEIENYEEHVAFTSLGQSQQNQILFYLFTFLGLALPYSCILERNIARYDCGILKRLTC